MRVYWTFKVRVESKKTPYTKEVVKELHRLFEQSEIISHAEVEEISS